MKRTLPMVLALLALSTSAFAQAAASQEEIDLALIAAPPNMREGATVIKWKPDFTYDVLRKGTNRMVCMNRSGQPSQPAFVIECTSIGNLERLAQNMKFEVETARRPRSTRAMRVMRYLQRTSRVGAQRRRG